MVASLRLIAKLIMRFSDWLQQPKFRQPKSTRMSLFSCENLAVWRLRGHSDMPGTGDSEHAGHSENSTMIRRKVQMQSCERVLWRAAFSNTGRIVMKALFIGAAPAVFIVPLLAEPGASAQRGASGRRNVWTQKAHIPSNSTSTSVTFPAT
jgi:hypothetical protein